MAALDSLIETVKGMDDSDSPHYIAGALVAVHGFGHALWRASLLSSCYARHGNHASAEAWRQIAQAIEQARQRSDDGQEQPTWH